MGNPFKDVYHFHRFYGANVGVMPAMPSVDRISLRMSLHDEEAKELREAITDRDLTKVVDALLDSIYVHIGTALEFGVSPEKLQECWDAVQRANMSKGMKQEHDSNCRLMNTPAHAPGRCDCGTVVYRDDGKILKGPYFSPPDEEIKSILGV